MTKIKNEKSKIEKPPKKHFDDIRGLFLSPSNYGKSMLISEFVIDRIK